MAGLSFKKQFAPKIKAGEKPWTIRAFRKRPIKVGERLFMYSGLRTKFTKKICEALCTWTSVIHIYSDGVIAVDNYGESADFVTFGPYHHDYRSADWFARKDGFANWEEMKAFWIKSHGDDCFPFEGTIIAFKKVRALPRKKVKARKPVRRKAKRSLVDVVMNSKVTKLSDGSGFFKALI